MRWRGKERLNQGDVGMKCTWLIGVSLPIHPHPENASRRREGIPAPALYCGRTGDLDGAVGFYRSVLEHGGPVYANSFVALLTAYAEKVNSVLLKHR
jgi:hypothetical protein